MSRSFGKRSYEHDDPKRNKTTIGPMNDDDNNENNMNNIQDNNNNDDDIIVTKDRFDNTTTGNTKNSTVHGSSSANNDDNNDNDDDNDNVSVDEEEKTIEFDVGGRIYKVRRSLLDLYPSTILSRSAADLWNTSTSDCHRLFSNTFFTTTTTANVGLANHDTTTTTATTSIWNRRNSNDSTTNTTNNNNNNKKRKKTMKRKPIYIDRDSHRFSYILDYMRDGGIVELPVTISKESFIKDLLYYGFDSITVETITCAIPTYEAVLQISNLHEHYKNRVRQSDIENDYIHLSYACFCNFVQTRSLQYVVRSNPTNNNKQQPSRHYCGGGGTGSSSSPKVTLGSANRFSSSSSSSTSNTHVIDIHHGIPTPSTKDIFNIAKELAKDYQNMNNNNNNNNNNTNNGSGTTTATTAAATTMNLGTSNSKIDLFNKFLHEYGLHCTIAEYDSSLYATTIQMIAYDKEPTL